MDDTLLSAAAYKFTCVKGDHSLEIATRAHVAIASMMGRPAGIRKARTALSVSDKKKVLDELKTGKAIVDVAAKFQISRRQVSNIRKHSDAVVKCITRRDMPIHSKLTSNKAKHPNIDMAVFEWFHSIRVLWGCRKPLAACIKSPYKSPCSVCSKAAKCA